MIPVAVASASPGINQSRTGPIVIPEVILCSSVAFRLRSLNLTRFLAVVISRETSDFT